MGPTASSGPEVVVVVVGAGVVVVVVAASVVVVVVAVSVVVVVVAAVVVVGAAVVVVVVAHPHTSTSAALATLVEDRFALNSKLAPEDRRQPARTTEEFSFVTEVSASARACAASVQLPSVWRVQSPAPSHVPAVSGAVA
jgi:hypothetical protein